MTLPRERPKGTREALMHAALTVVATEGLKNVTHRKVATMAKVSLGTTSYHWESLDHLLLDAFRSHIDDARSRYEQLMSEATNASELADALIELVNVHHADPDDPVLMYELYAQGVRDPKYRALVQRWSRGTKHSMEHLVRPETATKIEAFIEGALFQRTIGDGTLSDRQLRIFLLEIINQGAWTSVQD